MMSLSMGKGVCWLKDRNWPNRGTVWHAGFLARRSGAMSSLLMTKYAFQF